MAKLTRHIRLIGVKDIMFDRYAGDNKTVLEPYQKLYLRKDGGRAPIMGIPTANIISFLAASNTESAARLVHGRSFREVANEILGFADLPGTFLPLIRDDEPLRFEGFAEDREEGGAPYVHYAVARLDKGIPNPKARPTVPTPWELEFDMTFQNSSVENKAHNLFVKGGMMIGLGTFRKVFGKFEVDVWE